MAKKKSLFNWIHGGSLYRKPGNDFYRIRSSGMAWWSLVVILPFYLFLFIAGLCKRFLPEIASFLHL
jgi:hypothetical protein